jgi:hypothetical protein
VRKEHGYAAGGVLQQVVGGERGSEGGLSAS